MYCGFFSNCFPIASSEMTGILAELVSGGLGFHETQLPERILQSEDARCVIVVIYILRFFFNFIYLLIKAGFSVNTHLPGECCFYCSLAGKLHSHDIYL